MITLGVTELAIAERVDFSAQIEAWAARYAQPGFGLDPDTPYLRLQLRTIAMRCRKNGIREHANIETLLDLFFRQDLSLRPIERLLSIVADPSPTEEAKMAEISKQFMGARPTRADGFAVWKMP
ncbi:hypothetical protein ABFT80_26835 [Mesorhizobium sp. SB112]|uniref:hypothetical protein n=1 Tax=Mesorhizobium sp. SB112 TaxID=3151853 RepID=UPI0032655125